MSDALDRLRAWFSEHKFSEFANADDFARQLLDQMEHAFGSGWGGRAVTAINTTTRGIYEYYRLKDITVFGEESPIRLKLGGPDRASIKFIGKLDHFYFSKFADNTREPMRKFFVDQYFENGAALFGRETSDELAAFRKASGDKFKNLTNRQTLTVVQTAVARTRNWAHVGTLSQNGDEWAQLVATLDARTTPLCEFLNGKLFRIGAAQDTIERLNALTPADFEKALYKSDLSKGIAKNPVDTIKRYLEDDEGKVNENGRIISNEMVETGRGFPPYHPNCRTRIRGLVAGIDDIPEDTKEK